MQREIANVAAHCALQGFRYMAFPPPVFEPVLTAPTGLHVSAETERPEALPEVVSATRPAEAEPAMATGLSGRVAALVPRPAPPRARGIPLLDDIAGPRASAGSRARRETPAAPKVPAKRAASPQAARQELPPARAQRANRYALLRDLSDGQH